MEEEPDGEANGWPMLCKAIRMAEDNAERDLLVVIPTLDGVQFNLSFLRLLLVEGNPPVYVRSGWRMPKRVAQGTNYERRAESLFGWLLSLREEADAFANIVEQVRRRNRALRRSISAGLQKAAARGTKLGARRRGSYRCRKADQSKDGKVTAKKRQLAANDPYREWMADICRWRVNGESIGEITMRLADKGARTPDGGKIGPMLVYRILKRELARTGRKPARPG